MANQNGGPGLLASHSQGWGRVRCAGHEAQGLSTLDPVASRGNACPMFPLRDHNPSGQIPIISWTLIALNVGIWLQVTLSYPEGPALYRFYADWALVPRVITQGGSWHGLVTSTFLHAGIFHLGGNMLFLWIFGDNLEATLGRLRFLLFYLAGGVIAGLAQWAVDPWSLAPTIGASGAVAAVMGGYLLFFPRARVDVLVFFFWIIRILPFTAWSILLVWLIVQIVGGLSAGATSGGIAYWAHIGGFLGGIVLLLPLWLWRGGPGLWQQNRGIPHSRPARWGPIKRTTMPRVRRRIRRRPGTGPWG